MYVADRVGSRAPTTRACARRGTANARAAGGSRLMKTIVCIFATLIRLADGSPTV